MKFSSVLSMVKELSDPEFAKEFAEELKKITVYVYTNSDRPEFLQVFTNLKSAKKYVEGIEGYKFKWSYNSARGWRYGIHRILKRKIIKV